MGYTTDFNGSLKLSRPVTEKEQNYINGFSGSRRMKRDIHKLVALHNGQHGHPTPEDSTPEAIYGTDGEYFAMDDGQFGQSRDDSILDYNQPPSTQPGLWCQWVLNDPEHLEWDGGEKFYSYTEWLKYLIKEFFKPWGIKLNGSIKWYGEDPEDVGIIVVVDNSVTEKAGRIEYD